MCQQWYNKRNKCLIIDSIVDRCTISILQGFAPVDLRIIVMAYDRPTSMLKCLQSLRDLVLDGDRAVIDVWLDRGVDGKLHDPTVQAASNFKWELGPVIVHKQERHAGIYGQWIETWRPQQNSKEIAIFLEDDVDLSPYAYRWLKAAYKHFENQTDIAGYSLYEAAVVNFKNPPDLMFFHARLGTQGFSPTTHHWRAFQDWFHEKQRDPTFHPYVKYDTIVTDWYKGFEKTHREKSMWSMWFIRFCDDNKLWTVYPNFSAFSKTQRFGPELSANNTFMAYHRREKGLHFKGTASLSNGKLVSRWQEYFVQFPQNINKYYYNGQKVSSFGPPSVFYTLYQMIFEGLFIL